MRLAVFIPTLDGGGAERVMLRVAGDMCNRGHHVRLIVGSRSGDLFDKIPDGVELVDLKASRLLFAVRPLAKELIARPCDTLLSAMTATNCVAALAKRLSGSSFRLVMSERAFPSRVGFRGRINKILIPFLRSKLYSDADLITTVSLEVKEDLHRLVEIPDNRVLAIYNPSPSIKQDRCNVPHEWALSDRTIPLFLSAGRLNDQKDQATLIRAFAQIVRRRPSRLVILGEGEKRVELETLIDNLGISQHVLLPGFSTSALDWMRGTDVFVMSSVMEGMPNVLVEALSMGKKVVCTACVGGPREVLGYGRYGRLVPERDPDCLAVAMEQSLDMPDPERDTLALERFDPSVIFDAYENALVG